MMTPTIVIGLLFLNALGLVSGADEKTLFEHLFSNGHYNNHVRPLLDSKDAINVTIDFELNQITSLDEKSQVLSIVGFVLAEWVDDYLVWDASQYDNVTRVVVKPTDIWLPDFGVLNSVDTFYHDEFTKDFRVTLHSNGHVTWSFGGNFRTSCNLDNTFYPFDLQKCNIELENWAYTEDQVDLTIGHKEILLGHYAPHGIWDVDHTEVHRKEIVYETHPEDHYPEVVFTMYLRRKSQYYFLNIIAPCGFILMVALGVFWLPADSGEKLGFAVTVLLAFSVFQLVINEQTPQNSDYNPLLGILVLGIMGLASISVICCIIVLYLHHKGSNSRPPKGARKFFFKYLARFMCMGSEITPYVDDKISPNTKTNDSQLPIVTSLSAENLQKEFNDTGEQKFKDVLQETNNKEIVEILRYMQKRMQNKDSDEEYMDEWRSLAKVLDRFLFWIAVLVTIIIVAGIFGQRDSSHDDISH